MEYAVSLVYRVCCLAGSANLINEVLDDDICAAIAARDTAAMFDWLVSALSYQGISDQIAYNYMERHGRATWRDINDNLSGGAAAFNGGWGLIVIGRRFDVTFGGLDADLSK